MFCRTIIQCVAQIENVSPQHHRQQCVSNIAFINIERAYANSLVNIDTNVWIVSLISSAIKMAKTAFSFNVFYELI